MRIVFEPHGFYKLCPEQCQFIWASNSEAGGVSCYAYVGSPPGLFCSFLLSQTSPVRIRNPRLPDSGNQVRFH